MKKRNLLFLLGIIQINFLVAQNSVKQNCCNGPVLCPMSPIMVEAGCCHRMHFDIGLLYQSPQFEGAISGVSYTPMFPFELEEVEDDLYIGNQLEKPLHQCFPYALGVTVSLGRYIEHDDFYIGARFDYLRSYKAAAYDTTDRPGYLLRPNSNLNLDITEGTDFNADDDTLTKIIYNGAFKLYQLDVLMSRGSYYSSSFSYEPFAGIKALWFSLDQDTSNFSSDFDGGNYMTWQERQDSWGAGPLFGFNTLYHFTCKLALFSDSDIALLYGESRLQNISTLVGVLDAPVEVDQVIDRQNNEGCQFYVPLRTILGVQLADYCFEKKHYLAAKVGFDVRAVIAYPTDVRGFFMQGVYANLVWNF